MKKNILTTRICAFLLALLLAVGVGAGSFNAQAYEAQLASVKTNSLNVRSGPGTDYSRVTSLTLGAQVTVVDEVNGSDGQIWCKINYANGTGSGYVAKQYLGMASSLQNQALSDSEFEAMLANQQFPESYKPYLRALHSQYPNWTFKAVHTGLDWNTAVDNEAVVGRNLVHTDSRSSWKSVEQGAYDWDSNYWPGFDTSAWVAASRDVIEYYMDPRNFLDSTYVFQFLDQLYVPEVQKASGLEKMVSGTFLAGTASGGSGSYTSSSSPSPLGTGASSGPGSTSSSGGTSQGPVVSLTGPGGDTSSQTSSGPGSTTQSISGPTSVSGPSAVASSGSTNYVDIIMNAAQQSGVNPYVLASMIIQEQGTNGSSGLISGNTAGYNGIYNFYNVEAYQSGSMSPTERGLWWASQSGSYDRPWTSPEKAIVGGAKFYGENYTKAKQNTFYLKKFNVNSPSNLYKHQYMTNVQAAASEGYHLAQAYTDELRTAAHDFEIPVYKNMPESPCPCPQGDGSPNNKLSGLGVEGFALTPTFNKDTQKYDLIVDPSVASVNVLAQTIDSGATVSGTGSINLSSGTNQIVVKVTAQNGTTREYKINIVRQAGGPTYSAGVGGLTSSGPGNPTIGSSSSGSGSSSSSGSLGGPGGTNVIIISTKNSSSQNTNTSVTPGASSGPGSAQQSSSSSTVTPGASSGPGSTSTSTILVGPGNN